MKYRVNFLAVASYTVEVDAEDEQDAIDKAYDHLPSRAWDWPEMGDWTLPSDLFPSINTAEDDVEQVEAST